MSENTGSSKKRKVLSATLAVATVGTMLLSGTLAYFYHSTAVNVFKDEKTTKNVVLHDDFDEKTGNKDIYVENLGTSTVFVRVRLTQDYWDSEQALIEDEDDTTPPYSYMAGYEELSKGTGDSATKVGAKVYKLSEHQTTAEKNFHQNYFSWTMGEGKQKTYLSAAANDATQVEQYGDSMATADAHDGKYIEKKVAYDPQNAGEIYQLESTADSLIKTTGKCDGVIAATAWETLPNTESNVSLAAQVEKMKENRYAWTGWIQDATSGWFYWTQPLKGGETTGLLLDQIDKLKKIADRDLNYEYHIHVECEAVNTTDMDLWTLGKNTETSGDSWQAAGNTDGAPFWVIPSYLFARLIEQAENDLDGVIAEAETWMKGLSATGQSSGAVNLLNQALYNVYRGNGKAADLREALKTAKSLQAEYQAAKEAYEAGEGEDPDASLFGPDDEVDPQLKTFLVNTYGSDGELTKEMAKGLTSIAYDGTGLEADKKITDISFITGARFPKLESLSICNDNKLVAKEADDSTLENPKYIPVGTNLPKTIKFLYFTDCTKLTCVDVSQLSNLEMLRIDGTNIDHYGKTDKGAIDFGGEDGKSGVNATLLKFSIRYTAFKSFDINDFPRLTKVWIHSPNAQKVNLVGGTNLQFIYLKDHNVFQVDFSDCAFSTFSEPDMFEWETLKAITIREEQQLQTTFLPTGETIVKVVDTADKTKVVRYEKWNSTGKIQTWTESDGNLTDGETAFTAAVAAAEQAEREAGVA